MGIGPTELIIVLPLFFFLVVLPIWGLVDAAVRPTEVWAAAGQSKVVWIVLQIVLGVIGAALYFLMIRPKLTRLAPS